MYTNTSRNMSDQSGIIKQLATGAPLLFHAEDDHNNQSIVEGGFLSGRNPFVFVPFAPLPTFIVQLVVIVCMSRFVKFFLSPIKQPGMQANKYRLFMHICSNHAMTHYFTLQL